MGTLQSIHQWSLAHHPRWLVVIRVLLGICLFTKGISFLINTATLETLIQGRLVADNADWIIIGITWAHLLGGFLIIIGLLTRWSALLQIPILVGAVFFIQGQQDSLGWFELPFAMIVLLMLIFFLIEGGGPISLDNYFRKNPK